MKSPSTFQRLAWLLIVVGAVCQLARILSLGSKNDPTPFFSANDRSRWCTVASLVEDGTYEIDRVIAISDDGRRRPWHTIDMVRHAGPDGQLHYYSSKPPLLATLYAGVYAPIYHVLGIRLTEHPHYVAKMILVIVNWMPLVGFWYAMSRWVERSLVGLWARMVMMFFIVFGTFMVTFANTMNNHLPGALAVAASLIAWQRVAEGGGRIGASLLAGAAAAFAATCDLPALSWFGVLGLLLMREKGWSCVAPYLLGAAPVAAAFFGTNYLAHQEWRPAYAHRGVGQTILVSQIQDPHSVDSVRILRDELKVAGWSFGLDAELHPAARLAEHWELRDPANMLRVVIVARNGRYEVCRWDDWYDYPGSYWLEGNPKGVDRGEPSPWFYAAHSLIGHHGILSLTPFWLLGLIALPNIWKGSDRSQARLMAGIGLVTVVCLAFYFNRPLIDRNYGGVSSGFRWAFWMIPLWLIPSMEGLKTARMSPIGRNFATATLSISVFSACFPWSNPWVHPWIFQWWSYFQWIEY